MRCPQTKKEDKLQAESDSRSLIEGQTDETLFKISRTWLET